MTQTQKKPAATPAAAPTYTPRPPRTILYGVVAVALLTALDLGSKAWAEETLSRARRGETPAVCEPGEDGWSDYQRLRGDSIPLVEDVLELEYAENCGAAFSLLHQAPHDIRRAIFSLAALLAIIVLSVMFVQGRGGAWFAFGVPMVVCGALGNLIDRIRYGYVVDFIHFHWHDAFDYPVFNVADIGVVVGVILLVIDGWRTKDEPSITPAVARAAAPAAVAANEEEEADEDDEEEDEDDREDDDEAPANGPAAPNGPPPEAEPS